jgi:hypothetical protein
MTKLKHIKELTKDQLDELYGHYSGDEVLANAQSGYYVHPKTNEVTIVSCCGNCGDYSRVTVPGTPKERMFHF